ASQASENCRHQGHVRLVARDVPALCRYEDVKSHDQVNLFKKEPGMAGVLDSVNQRTQLVGQNRLELLLFRLDGPQLYGINVFKVKEILPCPHLSHMPKSSSVVCGVATIRGGTIPILDMALATGRRPLADRQNSFVIIAEYNMRVVGFLVRSVERIANLYWDEIHQPPKGTGREHRSEEHT